MRLLAPFLLFALLASATDLCSFSGSTEIHKEVEAWQGKNVKYYVTYTNWVPDYSQTYFNQLHDIWNLHGESPFVSWQPIIGWDDSKCPPNVDALIASGHYDFYIKDWISRWNTFLRGNDGVWDTADDRWAVMRIGHEMNGNWYPYSPNYPGSNDTVQDYINMWKHVKTMFNQAGVNGSRLPFVFCPNFQDSDSPKMEEFWPGSEYVDWLCVDGYNWGTTESWSKWVEPSAVFDDMIGRLRKLGGSSKYLAIGEYGSVKEGGDKSKWIEDAVDYFISQNINVACYFNYDMLPQDWGIFGGKFGDDTYQYNGTTYNVWAGYKNAIQKLNS